MDLRVINVSITMKGFSKTFSSADGFNIRVMGNKTSDTPFPFQAYHLRLLQMF